MKGTHTVRVLVGATLALASAATTAMGDDRRAVESSDGHDSAYYAAQAAGFERKGDFYATLAREYAAGGKPAVVAQFKHYGDLRDKFQRLASQSRDRAGQAKRDPSRETPDATQ